MERVLRLGRVTFEVATGTPRAEAGLHGNGRRQLLSDAGLAIAAMEPPSMSPKCCLTSNSPLGCSLNNLDRV